MKVTWLGLAIALTLLACSDDTNDRSDDDDDDSARCPAVCAKFETLFSSYGPTCMVEQCHCKEACADEFEASIDCLPAASPDCTCNGNELDCGTTCGAENQAANACFQAN